MSSLLGLFITSASSLVIFGILFGDIERRILEKPYLKSRFNLAFWLAFSGVLLIPIIGIKEAIGAHNPFEKNNLYSDYLVKHGIFDSNLGVPVAQASADKPSVYRWYIGRKGGAI